MAACAGRLLVVDVTGSRASARDAAHLLSKAARL